MVVWEGLKFVTNQKPAPVTGQALVAEAGGVEPHPDIIGTVCLSDNDDPGPFRLPDFQPKFIIT